MARLLIISDDTHLFQMLRKQVEECGHHCDSVQSDSDIQKRLAGKRYDLVLCSTHLKEASGFLLTKSLLENHADVAVFMVVNQEVSNLAEKVETSGAIDFIKVPVDPDCMRVCLNNFLYRQKIENENSNYKNELKDLIAQQTKVSDQYEERVKSLLEKLEVIQIQTSHAEKMASIGQLAAGVAHEINNSVGFVGSNLNTLQHYQKSIMAILTQYRKLLDEAIAETMTSTHKSSLTKRITKIKRLQDKFDLDYVSRDAFVLIRENITGILQVKNIVRDLKVFAHPDQEHPESFDIHKHLDATLNLVRNQLKYGIKLQKEYGDLPKVKGWADQLNQVFLNIMVNAIQAIGEKGTLTIKTDYCDDNCVEIQISDTGAGILKENLASIFEPFFTTKPSGKGTGLGLHISYNIIKKHKGTITVESKVGYGSTFTIKLPVESKRLYK